MRWGREREFGDPCRGLGDGSAQPVSYLRAGRAPVRNRVYAQPGGPLGPRATDLPDGARRGQTQAGNSGCSETPPPHSHFGRTMEGRPGIPPPALGRPTDAAQPGAGRRTHRGLLSNPPLLKNKLNQILLCCRSDACPPPVTCYRQASSLHAACHPAADWWSTSHQGRRNPLPPSTQQVLLLPRNQPPCCHQSRDLPQPPAATPSGSRNALPTSLALTQQTRGSLISCAQPRRGLPAYPWAGARACILRAPCEGCASFPRAHGRGQTGGKAGASIAQRPEGLWH